MRKFTCHALVAAIATLNLAAARPGLAQDQGLQIAGGVLQTIADGLNGATAPLPPSGFPGFDPNPVVFDSGEQVTGAAFDAFGRPVVTTNQTIMNQSALDPNRNTIDPGSFHTNSFVTLDAAGNSYRVTTDHWTSFGVPHSNSQRELITQGVGGATIQNQSVMKMAPSHIGKPLVKPQGGQLNHLPSGNRPNPPAITGKHPVPNRPQTTPVAVNLPHRPAAGVAPSVGKLPQRLPTQIAPNKVPNRVYPLRPMPNFSGKR